MFYLPFEFNQQKEYCTPKGPSFKRARLSKFSINGNEIRLLAPRHRAAGPFTPVKPHNPRKSYDLNDIHLRDISIKGNNWKGISTLYRVWDFYGPWFTGRRARLDLSAYIITPSDLDKENSYFHPRTFEDGIADYLTYLYKKQFEGEQNWFAPTNWKPVTSFPCAAATFEVKPNKNISPHDSKYYLIFPISDHHLISISLSMIRVKVFIKSDTTPESDTDKWINRAPMEELARDILNSVELTLSPEAQAMQQKALEGLDDTSLVKTFLPLKWTDDSPILEEM